MPRYSVNVIRTITTQLVAPIIVQANDETDARGKALGSEKPATGWTVRSRSAHDFYDDVHLAMNTAGSPAVVPIYDQPDHPHYGEIRRLHIMLMQIAPGKDAYAKLEQSFTDQFHKDWTWCFIDLLKDRTEAEATRFVLRYAIDMM